MSPEDLNEKYKEYIIDLRKYFHQYPELSGNEKNTYKKITEELSKFNIEYKTVGEYGILGVLQGKNPGKTIALRADMDALPILENEYNLLNKRKVISKVEGISHMCGHDCHMSIMLTVAKVLSKIQNELNGTILFCFESGEEKGLGIKDMLKALEDFKVDAIWGNHVLADLPAGMISVNQGVRMSGVSAFDVTIKGKGGHGSRPDKTIDPINCTVQILCNLSSIQSRVVNPRETIVLTVGQLNAGHASNIIPETAYFSGTIRFFDYKEESKVKESFYTIVNNVANANNCSALINYDGPTPPVINDSYLSEIAEKSIKKAVGEECLMDAQPWLASEPFGRYTEKYPGIYAFLGINNEKLGTGASHHNSRFDIDEDCLYVGVAATVQFVIDFLK